MDYFIADLHFGHLNIISLCNRPYNSVEEMDEAFINAWNKRVKKKADTVYIVGDFVWEKADPLKYIKRLNGHKVLITGNHDKKWLAKQDYSSYFDKIVPYLEIRSNDVDITLCHYPMLEWKNSRKIGSKKLGYLVHGHIHNRYCNDYAPLFYMPHALNAGVDINGFMPVTLSELIKNNESNKKEKLTNGGVEMKSFDFNGKSRVNNEIITYFKVIGDFEPDKITERLNLTPSRKWCKGDKRKVGTYTFSLWEFGRIEKTNNVFVDEQIKQTINPLLDKINILNELKSELNVKFVLEVVPKFYTLKDKPVLSPSKEVVDFCHAIDADLDIDYYFYCDK